MTGGQPQTIRVTRTACWLLVLVLLVLVLLVLLELAAEQAATVLIQCTVVRGVHSETLATCHSHARARHKVRAPRCLFVLV